MTVPDLSALKKPPVAPEAPKVQRVGDKQSPFANAPAPDVEPYPSEMPKVKHAAAELHKRFANKVINTEQMIDDFHTAAIDLFAEAGFTIGVAWDVEAINGQPTGRFRPTISIAGRVTPETETDHDRLKHDITHGLADGQAGYIRPDGTKREDPKSRLIV